MHTIKLRCGIVVLCVVISGCFNDVRLVEPGHFPVEFLPIWEEHFNVDDDWEADPRLSGFTTEQKQVIEQFDRVWVATIVDRKPGKAASDEKLFYRSRILGFREIRNKSQMDKLRLALVTFANQERLLGSLVLPDGSSDLAVRLQAGENFTDLLIDVDYKLLFVYDQNKLVRLAYPKDSKLPTVLSTLSSGLPIYSGR